jgi:hypothetical protein
MPTAVGPNIVDNGLTVLLDGSIRQSTLQVTQLSNLLENPHRWTTGTGGQTGYSANGSTSEQNRVSVTDDPWGRTSITWRTTPDDVSGADGGWNSSYYTIDTNYTYRYSMWVRRYTSGTGGTFYMGMNPNPLRNDNDASQGNPYFTYPSIASLTQNQWYLIVAHVFYEGYTGGRHPESGWYEDGVKISDKSYGNVGSSDVRWASGTTSARHRAYHYYTTNVSSGIEFAYPRLDKLDGFQPTIGELLNSGESGWRNIINNAVIGETYNGVSYTPSRTLGSYSFDGTNDGINLESSIFTGTENNVTLECIVKLSANQTSTIFLSNYTQASSATGLGIGISDSTTNKVKWFTGNLGTTNTLTSTTALSNGTYYHVVGTYNGSSKILYINGTSETSTTITNGINITSAVASVGYLRYLNNQYLNGEVPLAKIYNRALTAQEVRQNYQQYKTRFNLS